MTEVREAEVVVLKWGMDCTNVDSFVLSTLLN